MTVADHFFFFTYLRTLEDKCSWDIFFKMSKNKQETFNFLGSQIATLVQLQM